MDEHDWPAHLYKLGLLTGRDLDAVQLEILESGVAPEAHLDVLAALARAQRRQWNILWPGATPSVYLAARDLVVYGTWRSGFAVMTHDGEPGALPAPERSLLIVADASQRRDLEATGLLPLNVKFTAGLTPDDVLSVLAGQPAVVFHPSPADLTGVLAGLLEHVSADTSGAGRHPAGVVLSDQLLSNLTASQIADVGTAGHALVVRGGVGGWSYVPPFVSAPEDELIGLLDLISRALGRGGRLDVHATSWRQRRDEEAAAAHEATARQAEADEDARADRRLQGYLRRREGQKRND